jgi:hypothetical protein
MTSISITTAKPLFNPQPDYIERALMLIDKHEKPFGIENNELTIGLELIGKILDGMKIIQMQ